MIGLPTESDADLDELVTLVREILAEGRRQKVRATVNVSVGSFVPKSFTPFQWAPFDGLERLTAKLSYLKERFRDVRGVKLKWHEPRESEIEALLSLGDRRLGRALLEVHRLGGRFDGWSEHFSWEKWNEGLAAAGLPKERTLRAKGLDETLPWEVIDASIRKPFLVAEWRKAEREMETEDCKWGRCLVCGVPGNGTETVLAAPLPLPAFPENATDARDAGRGSAYTEAAKGAATRRKATPDLLPERPRRTYGGAAAPVPATAGSWRISFEKLGDARYLSHRNTMDLLERALRACWSAASI